MKSNNKSNAIIKNVSLTFYKGILLLFVALLLVAGCVRFTSIDVGAASKVKVTKVTKVAKDVTFTQSKINYKITSVKKQSGTVTVTGGNATLTKVEIPATVKVKKSGKIYTMKVTAIDDNAFSYSYKLNQITIGKYVEKIGKNAFSYCTQLKKVYFKKGSKLKKIEDSAFAYTYDLKSFNFSSLKYLSTIADNAFLYCNNLKNIPIAKIASVKKLIKKASKYTYTVTPVMAPFNKMFYVETDNPDGSSFMLADYNVEGVTPADGYILMAQDTNTYCDVVYENESKKRVKGGYIFSTITGYSDEDTSILNGGELSLMVYLQPYGYIDTGIKVDCPEVCSATQYVLDRFTTSNMDFETKVNAIREGVNKYYPGYVCVYDDVNTSNNKIKFPLISMNAYGDIIEDYYGVYGRSDSYMLADLANPLSGNGANNVIKKAVKKAYPDSTYEYSYYGGMSFKNGDKSVSVNNVSDDITIYRSIVNKDYKFDGSKNDKMENFSLTDYKNDMYYYDGKGEQKLEKLKTDYPVFGLGTKIASSAWFKIYNGGYVYATEGARYIHVNDRLNLKDSWVDGRYVNRYGIFTKGATFEEHPTADIVLTNQTYKNVNGITVTGDITYEYSSSTGTWESRDYYITVYSLHSYSMSMQGTKPAKFTLTKEQVEQLDVDKNTNIDPVHGYMFDGTVKPGTTF